MSRRGQRLADPRRRLRGAFGMFALVVFLLGGRLVQLQGLEATAYAAKAERQRTRSIELRAERGRILDRNLVPLAMDVDARSVYADPTLVKNIDQTAHALAGRLRTTPTALADKLRHPTARRFVYLARSVDPTIARTIVTMKLPGIGTLKESKRLYPNGSLAAGIVGFVGNDGRGLAGIESTLDKDLKGKPGELLIEADGSGRQIPSGAHSQTEATPGTSQVLTIDRDIQWAAEQAIAAQVAATQSVRGTVLVMDVQTGEVLALATVPSFDPNTPVEAGRLGANPAISQVYEPGSVNKVIVAAAALERGLVTPTTPITVPTSIKVADKTFHELHATGPQRLTFTGVLAQSSNVGTITVAQQLGRQPLYDFLRRFGFGERTGIRFPGESPGILPPPKQWSGSQAGTIPIGQGVAATALQIASVYATVANDGIRVTPNLIRGAIRGDGTLVPAPAPKSSRVISSKTAAELRLMLEAVTNKGGTATSAAIAGYRVAGKTGTARRIKPEGGYEGYVASFVGFAPADAPRLVVEVVLDDPRAAIYGGIVAAPVFRNVMSFALATLRVPPTGVTAPTPVPLTFS